MSRVLCTGGAGFIGSHVADALVAEGHEVAIVDNLSTGKRENLNPKAKFYNQDITDPYFWENIPKYEVVFHLAALPRIQPSILDPVSHHNANVNGTLQVLEYCRQYESKIVFSSSSSIYRGDALPTKEEYDKDPQNPYSLQKWLCEQYIELYHVLYGLDYAILRYFNVFGERQLLEGAYATVIGIFLNQRAKGLPLTITNDGEQRRDFTYVGDVARANLMAVDWQGAWNIGAGKSYSINAIADMIGGKKKYIGERIGEVRETLADNTQARRLGWHPEVGVKAWLYGKI